MTDMELLELAAKAAGIKYDGCTEWKEPALRLVTPNTSKIIYWNPLQDDGDALRLAVKLVLSVEQLTVRVCCSWLEGEPEEMRNVFEPYGHDPYAATRRAIVRAAAEIGRMK